MAGALAADVAAAAVPEGSVALWWIGQGSFIFKGSDGTVLAIDPYLSDAAGKRPPPRSAPRTFPTLIMPEELGPLAAAVLCTHEHLDHVDPEAIGPLAAANPQARFIGPRGVRAAYAKFGVPDGQIDALDVGERIALGPWTITAVFADHPADGPIGFVLDTGTTRLYHSGDTEAHPRLAEVAPFAPSLATVVINGRMGNMGAAQAAETVRMIGAKAAIPTHYDLFASNQADPQDFVAALAREAPEARAVVLRRGQRFVWPEGAA